MITPYVIGAVLVILVISIFIPFGGWSDDE